MGIEMAFVKNATDKEIIQMFDGKDYTFPVGGGIEFEDANVARWFVAKLARPASPADGVIRAVYPLVIDAKPKVAPASTVEIPKQAVMLPVDRLETPPTAGHVHNGDPETKAIAIRKRINSLEKGELVNACKKHGLYQKYMDRPRMVEALAAVGFEPR